MILLRTNNCKSETIILEALTTSLCYNHAIVNNRKQMNAKEFRMSNTLIQFRLESQLKQDAIDLFAKLGLDLTTAIKIFLRRSVQVQGLPFSMSVKDFDALQAMRELNDYSQANGLSNLTLDEINDEINKCRRQF